MINWRFTGEPEPGVVVIVVTDKSAPRYAEGRVEMCLCVRRRIGYICRDETRSDANTVSWYAANYQQSWGDKPPPRMIAWVSVAELVGELGERCLYPVAK